MGAFLRIGLGVNDVNMRVWAVSDPHLAAIEHEVVTTALRPQLHADHIGPGVRLAHRQRPDMLATDQLGQVFCLLLRRAVAVDLVHAQVGMRPVGQTHRRRPTADLLHRHHMRQIPQPRAAVLLRHGNAQQPHVAKAPPHVLRKLILPVDLRRPRRQLGINQIAGLLAQHVDGLAKTEVQRWVMHGVTCVYCCWCISVVFQGRPRP